MGCGNSKKDVSTATEPIKQKPILRDQFTEPGPFTKTESIVQKPSSCDQSTETQQSLLAQPQPPPPVKPFDPTLKRTKTRIEPEDPGQYWTTSTPTDKVKPFDTETFQYSSFPPDPYWLGFPNPGQVGPVGPPDYKPTRRRRSLSERHGRHVTETAPSEPNEPPNTNSDSSQAQPAPLLYGPYWFHSQPPAQDMHPGAGSNTSWPTPPRQAQQFRYSLAAIENELLNQSGPTKPESPTPF